MTIGTKVMTGQVIAWRNDYDKGGPAWYVSQLPARKGSKRAKRDGVDWGYEKDRSKAIPLTPYWARRFKSAYFSVGYGPHFEKV